MGIHESGEMYLETIHVLLEKNGSVRSIDISEHMGYSKPSVSRAVGLLKNGGYILVDKDGYITFIGYEIADHNEWYAKCVSRDSGARNDYLNVERYRIQPGDLFITQILSEEMKPNDPRLR